MRKSYRSLAPSTSPTLPTSVPLEAMLWDGVVEGDALDLIPALPTRSVAAPTPATS